MGFPGGSDGKKILWIGNGYPLQYSFLENSIEEPGGLQSMGSQRIRHNWAHMYHIQFLFSPIKVKIKQRKIENFEYSINGLKQHRYTFFP